MTEIPPLKLTLLGKEHILPLCPNGCTAQESYWESGRLGVYHHLQPKFGKAWHIHFSGPWYDDSNPEGFGHTLEEAVTELETILKERTAILSGDKPNDQ